MSADFYGDFDRACLADDFNSKRQTDYRSIFHQDRDRVMFSPAFRRLQAKTQVFQAGEYDFYRTRLTHSLEVSRIAESLAIWLEHKFPEVKVNLHLLEAICHSHDIGHPPFGHAGERVLNKLMKNHGGFEGNAQTLRILTRTIYDHKDGRRGMSPSRALIDGVLKYKRLYRDRGDDTNHFIYDDQAEILDFCFGRSDLTNDFKSLECQIMDLADDIAYSCFDVVDGWKAHFLTPERLNARARSSESVAEKDHLLLVVKWMLEGKLQPKINGLIGELIQSASLEKAENFMSFRTKRYAYQLTIQPEAQLKIKIQKGLGHDLIFGSSAIQQIEYKGGMILGCLAKQLFGNYLGSGRKVGLLPAGVHQKVLATDDKSAKARLLCDHLSGMTDAYALRSYKRLLDPDFGSISELI